MELQVSVRIPRSPNVNASSDQLTRVAWACSGKSPLCAWQRLFLDLWLLKAAEPSTAPVQPRCSDTCHQQESIQEIRRDMQQRAGLLTCQERGAEFQLTSALRQACHDEQPPCCLEEPPGEGCHRDNSPAYRGQCGCASSIDKSLSSFCCIACAVCASRWSEARLPKMARWMLVSGL